MTTTHTLRTKMLHCKKQSASLRAMPSYMATLRHAKASSHEVSTTASCSTSLPAVADHVAPLYHARAATAHALGWITCKHRRAAQQPYAKFQSSCSPQTCSSKEGLRYDEHTHAAHKDAPLQEALPRLDAQCHHAWQSCATHKLSTACCAQGRPTARSTSAS